jgi:hypothetical protein
MCPSGGTCSLVDCCFREFVLLLNTACIAAMQQIPILYSVAMENESTHIF